MNFDQIKELAIKEFCIVAMDVLGIAIRVIDKIDKEGAQGLRIYKVKTKNYHVRLLADEFFSDSMVLYRPKGFFKDWACIDSRDIPNCIPRSIFSDSCTKENRKRLVNKIMELKAFW
jgi:hypothetical protein